MLPFANRSANGDDEYFCDGLADELLNLLARFSRASQAVAGVVPIRVSYPGAISPELLQVIEVFETQHRESKVQIVELPYRERSEQDQTA